MNIQKHKRQVRLRRKARVRMRITGTAQRPRLAVFRSLTGTSAQLIDDTVGKTLVFASTKEVKGKNTKTEAASKVGKLLAKKAIEAGIKQAVFDRSGYKFHGRARALADAAREGGLVI